MILIATELRLNRVEKKKKTRRNTKKDKKQDWEIYNQQSEI